MRFHGGRSKVALDFSVNTNPLGPPKYVESLIRECVGGGVLLKYPDYEYVDLRDGIAKFYGCDPNNIIVTNGANEALNLVITTLRKDLVVIEPSYGEYEDIANSLGVRYDYVLYKVRNDDFYLDLEVLDRFNNNDKIVVITNPNNPTGNYLSRSVLFNHIQDFKPIFLIDESYVELCDVCPYEIPQDIPENVVIVRSITKYTSLPGLRLGFLYSSNEELIKRLNVVRQAWNVNSLAECVFTKVFMSTDLLKEFISRSRHYISSERSRLVGRLRDLGLKVFNSVVNFLLINLGFNSEKVIKELELRGISVRWCWSFRGLGKDYIRISIRNREDNEVFIKNLTQIINGLKHEY
ncbi:MAG: histidinol-phosphate transaminase [Sulfolobales archaeon]